MNEIAKAVNCAEVAEELASQPTFRALLDAAEGRVPAPVFCENGVQRYTGERITEQKALEIGALRLMDVSDRDIERVLGCTRRTIGAVMQRLEKENRITPLQERLQRRTGENAESSGLLLKRLLERGLDGEVSIELASMIRAVGAVNEKQLEKNQLLNGQPTEIHEQRAAAGRDEIEAFWKSITPISATVLGATDLESSAKVPETLQTGTNPPPCGPDASTMAATATGTTGAVTGGGGGGIEGGGVQNSNEIGRAHV